MAPPKFPLEQLETIKKNRLDEAEKRLREKKEILEKEEVTLRKLEAEEKVVIDHKQDKLTQMREELDKGTTADKIKLMRDYMKVVEDELKIKRKKVKDQQKQVDNANAQVDIARKDLFDKQKDVEKLDIYRKEWAKEQKREEEHKDSLEGDEIGSSRHLTKKKRKH